MVKWLSKALLFLKGINVLFGKMIVSSCRSMRRNRDVEAIAIVKLAGERGQTILEQAKEIHKQRRAIWFAEVMARRLIEGKGKCPVGFARNLLKLIGEEK